MSPSFSPEALKAAFPYMFPLVGEDGRRAYRFFRGWLPAFASTCAEIDALLGVNKRGFHWTRIREKYGSPSLAYGMEGQARIAYNIHRPDAVQRVESKPPVNADPTAVAIHELVLQLEVRLRSLCIVCGAAAEITQHQGPWASLCAEHRAETFAEGHRDWRGSIFKSAEVGGDRHDPVP
jgi:hypothetical protein